MVKNGSAMEHYEPVTYSVKLVRFFANLFYTSLTYDFCNRFLIFSSNVLNF